MLETVCEPAIEMLNRSVQAEFTKKDSEEDQDLYHLDLTIHLDKDL